MAMTTTTLFPVADPEGPVILPSEVSFISDELKDHYLCSRVIDGYYNYHRFESGVDITDPVVAHQLFPTGDGNYRIKDLYFGKFWRRSPNWIWADAEDDDYSSDTLFSFVKLDDGVVALRNFGNNYFCGALTTEGKTNCLNAHYENISPPTRLIVRERVLKRTISDLRYRLSDSTIHDEQILELDHYFGTNHHTDKDDTLTPTFSISDSWTTSWNNSVSVKVGVKTELEVNIVPEIVKGKVETSTEIGTTHEWGGSTSTTIQRQLSYAVVVPPLSTMKVTLMCTRATCDVPFSYKQHDLLPNGKWVTTAKDDGIYKGINSYNFYVESTKVDP